MSDNALDEIAGKTADQINIGGKFLTFCLDKEEYGIEILKVREIIGMMTITPVPKTPDYVRGVINLRGKVIPVIDMRLKFGMSAAEQTEETCIIVVQADGIEMGTIVDSVSEVIDIPNKAIDPPPSFGDGVNTNYILGIGKVEDRVRLLLNIDRALESQRIINLPASTDEKIRQSA